MRAAAGSPRHFDDVRGPPPDVSTIRDADSIFERKQQRSEEAVKIEEKSKSATEDVRSVHIADTPPMHGADVTPSHRFFTVDSSRERRIWLQHEENAWYYAHSTPVLGVFSVLLALFALMPFWLIIVMSLKKKANYRK